MPRITSTQSAVSLNVAAGNTLIVRNITGTETVSGSSVAKEDATNVLGSGVSVYGPQLSASTITLSTSGTCDYDVVAGDPTPGTPPQLSGTVTISNANKDYFDGKVVKCANSAIVVFAAGLPLTFGTTLQLVNGATITIRSDGTVKFLVAGSAPATTDISRASTSNVFVGVQCTGTTDEFGVTGA